MHRSQSQSELGSRLNLLLVFRVITVHTFVLCFFHGPLHFCAFFCSLQISCSSPPDASRCSGNTWLHNLVLRLPGKLAKDVPRVPREVSHRPAVVTHRSSSNLIHISQVLLFWFAAASHALPPSVLASLSSLLVLARSCWSCMTPPSS